MNLNSPLPKRPSTWSNLQAKFVVGLLTILPVAIVWFVLAFLIDFLSWLGRPLIDTIFGYSGAQERDHTGWLSNEVVVTALAVAAALAIIYLVGAVASNVLGARFIRGVEAFVNRVPLVAQIYGAAQKLISSLTSKPDGMQRVVLLPFPSGDMRAIGFVTKTFVDEVSQREMAAVYVPTSPNPTSGYLEIVPIGLCIETDFTMDQAMNMILSGGATAPDRVRFGRAKDVGS
jgi:uncharacterized membrane protein